MKRAIPEWCACHAGAVLPARGRRPAVAGCDPLRSEPVRAGAGSFGPALKTIFAIVKQVWTAHPANADKVKMVTVHGYGPRRDGVRRSAF
jgi:hypothetical protein